MTDLTSPFTLRSGLVVPGRVALAPLTNTQSNPDGTLSDTEIRWLTRRARGGFAWVSTAAAYVSDEGKAWAGQLGVASDLHLPGLTRLARELREAGAVSIVQLYHGGIKAELAPGLRLTTADQAGARGATEADFDQVVHDFVQAALRSQAAGFDGVEVHGANGYLFTQFLAPADNPRTDAYGGSLENRARLLRQVVRAVRASVRRDFVVGVRLSPVDLFDRRGLVLDDSLQVARWLAEDGIDFLHLSLRSIAGPAPFEPERGSVTTAFRAVLPPEVPLLSVGGVWTAEDAQAGLAAGADLVVLGKAAIANPEWPHDALRPGWQPARPPWSRAHLAAADVGEALVRYLSPYPGLVEGGAAPRGPSA